MHRCGGTWSRSDSKFLASANCTLMLNFRKRYLPWEDYEGLASPLRNPPAAQPQLRHRDHLAKLGQGVGNGHNLRASQQGISAGAVATTICHLPNSPSSMSQSPFG